ncbi:hypothetical protein ACE6H2_004784 [Prunus campanulata]
MLEVVFGSSASGLRKHTLSLLLLLGCFDQSRKSSITILKIANLYLMPNKPNLVTILLKNPKLVETKKEGMQTGQRNCKISHLIQNLTGLSSSQANLTGLVFSKPFLLGYSLQLDHVQIQIQCLANPRPKRFLWIGLFYV